jgi:hypothetical protein
LGPSEIVRVGGGDFARPIVAETEGTNLPGEVRDVGLGGFARVLAGPHRVLLGGQTEGIPTHRMKDIESKRAAISGQDVRGGVALGMADVQAGARRVGKHVENVELARQRTGVRRAPAEAVTDAKWMRDRDCLVRVPGAKGLFGFPVGLPLRFDEMKGVLPPGHK